MVCPTRLRRPWPVALSWSRKPTPSALRVAAAENGDFEASEQKLRQVPPGHPVWALASLEVRFLRGEKVAGQALEFARERARLRFRVGFRRHGGTAGGETRAAR